MSAPDPAKIQKFREDLHLEWTGAKTVAAWRKWHAHIAAFSRGATEAILEAAQLRPGLRVLDLASGVGDPALSIAAEVAPAGRVTATDLGPGMMSLAEELARKNGTTNIEFREANAESLPFADESYDILTCRFGIMFFPDLRKALRECFRVLKPGGRAAFVAWGKKEQPFFGTTAGILLKHVPVPPPPPERTLGRPPGRILGTIQRGGRTLPAVACAALSSRKGRGHRRNSHSAEKILERQRIEHASGNRHRQRHAPINCRSSVCPIFRAAKSELFPVLIP